MVQKMVAIGGILFLVGQPISQPRSQPSEPMCATQACAEVAELAARQAYEVCRQHSGTDCTLKAIKAWLATGAIPPYAHPCTGPGPKDYLGRCR
jgi:hypothetical protein